MAHMLMNLVSRKAVLALAGVIGLGSVAATPKAAQAGFRIGFDLRDRPTYEQRTERVWVEPVYQTVCDRVWVAPSYQTVQERVWVPDQYEDRRVICRDGWRQRVEIQHVLVAPAHYEMQCRQVVACDGHWEDVRRQVEVAPGHWETRVDRVACNDDRGPQLDRLHIEFGGR